MLCHVIGFTDFEHHGIQGVEASMDEYLRAQNGYRYIEHNRAGEEIVLYRGQERAPRDGCRVQLTIDLNLQNIVENEIDAAMREYRPRKAIIILMRPQTGEILAMANRPNFDLNRRSRSKTRTNEEPGHSRHDGAGIHLQDRGRGRGPERAQGSFDLDHLLRKRASGILAGAPCTITGPLAICRFGIFW